MIVKAGNRYLVKDKAGKMTLGSHGSHAEALAQLRAIEISKHRNEPGATKPKPR